MLQSLPGGGQFSLILVDVSVGCLYEKCFVCLYNIIVVKSVCLHVGAQITATIDDQTLHAFEVSPNYSQHSEISNFLRDDKWNIYSCGDVCCFGLAPLLMGLLIFSFCNYNGKGNYGTEFEVRRYSSTFGHKFESFEFDLWVKRLMLPSP